MDEICMANEEKYKNSSQGQNSRSNVTNYQPFLAFTVRGAYSYQVTRISDQ